MIISLEDIQCCSEIKVDNIVRKDLAVYINITERGLAISIQLSGKKLFSAECSIDAVKECRLKSQRVDGKEYFHQTLVDRF